MRESNGRPLASIANLELPAGPVAPTPATAPSVDGAPYWRGLLEVVLWDLIYILWSSRKVAETGYLILRRAVCVEMDTWPVF